MKKFFAILAIVALASCGGSSEAPAADTTAVAVDTTAVVDTTAAVDTAAAAATEATEAAAKEVKEEVKK